MTLKVDAWNPRLFIRSVSNCFFSSSSGVFSFLGFGVFLGGFSPKPKPPQRSISPPLEDEALVVKEDSTAARTALFAATFPLARSWCPAPSSSCRISSILSKTLYILFRGFSGSCTTARLTCMCNWLCEILRTWNFEETRTCGWARPFWPQVHGRLKSNFLGILNMFNEGWTDYEF